jgi:hypothetical protein
LFFVSKDLKQKFCGNRCKDRFFNAKKDFKKLRQTKRTNLLAKARRLIKEKKDVTFVVQETGLSGRTLERAGLLKITGSRVALLDTSLNL